MSQEELAAQVGVHKNYISQIETGRKVPSLKTLSKIAKQLEVPPNSLLSADPILPELRQLVEGTGLDRLDQIIQELSRLREELRASSHDSASKADFDMPSVTPVLDK